ncbi:tryptophan synthase subunit alpha [Legionella fairfieldensis]|uniref:tryptophan synthase subunit alpha n=1 Tax=Legionella fairfieldensis TaxID=45064 RepID=UPI00048BF901|nr:tryptophan synthase subunit alpha [Legionella fairfieldensis]
MNRIDKMLERLRASNKKMLSPYLTAGDPHPDMTVPLMHELVAAGADTLEIGIPFSDPMVEGPVIQASMERALAYGINCDDVFSRVEKFRERDQLTPIVLMGYMNPVEVYGYENFAKRASQVGVDGTILVDLPPEESEIMAKLWDTYGLYSIYLCSPATADERMPLIDRYAKGYLYYASLEEVIGSHDFDPLTMKELYQHRKSQTALPLMVEAGTAPMAAEVAAFADGVIVDAALVSRIFDSYTSSGNASAAGAFLIRDMRYAMDNNGKNHD